KVNQNVPMNSATYFFAFMLPAPFRCAAIPRECKVNVAIRCGGARRRTNRPKWPPLAAANRLADSLIDPLLRANVCPTIRLKTS
ncbi:MAG TPA: hypothetical protein VGM09_11930, partial [Bradyrhizobium sp.]